MPIEPDMNVKFNFTVISAGAFSHRCCVKRACDRSNTLTEPDVV